jgi:uncharacterized membrane protein (DUF2068 family)
LQELHERDIGLSLIVLWKGVKATSLVVLASVVAGFRAGALTEMLDAVTARLHLESMLPGGFESRRNAALLVAALLGFATLYAVQGVALHRRKRWGEWLTMLPTASLLPIELYRIAVRPGAWRVLTLVVNAAIVAYLAARVRRRLRLVAR